MKYLIELEDEDLNVIGEGLAELKLGRSITTHRKIEAQIIKQQQELHNKSADSKDLPSGAKK